MKNENPIGFFDSGIGGITIWKEFDKILPHENTIYLADSKNAPYGQKTSEEIIFLSEKNTEFLLNRNSKIVVVACNTATTNAIDHLREKYKVPFIGIEPAIKPAALNSKTGKIGVLATKGTLTSKLFHKAVKSYENVEIIDQIGYGLVPLIEAGKIDSEEIKNLLKEYLSAMVQQNIDYLVLGCTHYPFLTDLIKTMLPDHIQIIDSGIAVAKHGKLILEKSGLLNSQKTVGIKEFYINADETVLKSLIPNNKDYIIKQMDF